MMATYDLADELRNVIKLSAPFREQFGTIHGNDESFEFASSKEIWRIIEFFAKGDWKWGAEKLVSICLS
jgi:hypothetical protein